MVFPLEVAFRFDTCPHVIDDGLAVTLVGAAGGPTVTVTGVLVSDAQVTGSVVHEMMTCPLPDLVAAVLSWFVPPL
jgi:hypothetical protein